MIKYKFLFFILLPILLQAQAISSLKVTGNINVEENLILSQSLCKVGQDCTEEQIAQSIKKLYATELFKTVNMNLQDGNLQISVKENPIIRSIILDGNKSVNTKELNKAMQLKSNSLFINHRLQKDILQMLNLYQKQGIFEVDIKPYQVQLENNKIDLLYKIQEGHKMKIWRMNFVNNQNYSDNILKRLLLSREYMFLNFLTDNHYYMKERLDIDKSLLQNFYFSKGFLNFKINSVITEFEDGWVDITFNVEEGKKYHINKVDVVSDIKNVDTKPILPLVEGITGKDFNINEINKAILDITTHLNNDGYYFIAVDPQYATKGDAVEITYRIKESKKVYIDRINVIGNDHTLEQVIRHELKVSEGDPYNLTKLQRSRLNIIKLGFFDGVDIKTIPTNISDRVDVELSVKERNTGFMNIGGAYSSIAGIVGNFSVNENNLLGTGNKIAFSLEKSSPTLNVSFSFTKPYTFNLPISSGFDLFKKYSAYHTHSSYKSSTHGITLRASYKIIDDLSHSLSYSYKRDNMYDVNDKASKLIKEQAGITHTSMVSHGLTYSKLDNPIRPQNGYILKLSQDLAGIGGDLYYLRSNASAINFMSKYGITLQASLKAGYIAAYNNQNVRIGERFFAGSTEIRGFKGSGIGPRDKATKESLGGKLRILALLQADFPIGFPEDLGIKGALFIDAASLTHLDVVSDNILDSGNLRASAGFGFSWFSPLGILRLDFGFPFLKDDYDQTETMRFSIGSQF